MQIVLEHAEFAERVELQIEVLFLGRDAGIADKPDFYHFLTEYFLSESRMALLTSRQGEIRFFTP